MNDADDNHDGVAPNNGNPKFVLAIFEKIKEKKLKFSQRSVNLTNTQLRKT